MAGPYSMDTWPDAWGQLWRTIEGPGVRQDLLVEKHEADNILEIINKAYAAGQKSFNTVPKDVRALEEMIDYWKNEAIKARVNVDRLVRQDTEVREATCIVRMQDYADLSTIDAVRTLYDLWQKAVHNPKLAELRDENVRLNKEIRQVEAINDSGWLGAYNDAIDRVLKNIAEMKK